jgi:hypothetical protein
MKNGIESPNAEIPYDIPAPGFPEGLPPAIDRGLEQMTEDELLSQLLAHEQWTMDDIAKITLAHAVAGHLHAEDKHRDQPYVMHPLLVANQVTSYLHVFNADIIAAALLHDTVEDRAKKLLIEYGHYFDAEGVGDDDAQVLADESENHQKAFRLLDVMFPGSEVSDYVERVSNLTDSSVKYTPEQKIEAYKSKVETSIISAVGFVIKFPDWVHNAVGISHGGHDPRAADRDYLRRKYSSVLDILEARFCEPDLQYFLVPMAKAYILQQLAHGRAVLPEGPATPE